MRVELIQVGQDGAESRRTLSGERIRIGRGASNEIQLTDLRAALDHAYIVREGNRAKIVATSMAGVDVNGVPARSAPMKVGTTIEIGLTTISVERSASHDFAVRVHTEVQDPDALPDPSKFQLSLTQSKASPRRAGWIAVAVIAALFLLWPLLGSQFAGTRAAAGSVGLAPEGAWVTGTSSSAHAHIMDDCAACHAAGFQQASETTCVTCHADLTNHSDAQWYTDHQDAELSCNDCHREHNGTDGLIARHPRDCVDCHADPAAWPQADLQIAKHFSRAHATFSPTVAVAGPDGPMLQEVSLPFGEEASGLYFDHDDHTSSAGVEGPDGTETLVCADCHVPQAGGVGFEPVDMEPMCQRCHTLTFDPDEPEARLPHAAVDLVSKSIDEHFARRALQGSFEAASANAPARDPLRRRPGSTMTAEQRRTALEWAAAEAAQTKQQVFSKNTCGVCHAAQSDGEAWDIQPVLLPDHFMTGAVFRHDGHTSMACTDCHATADSDAASDLLLPTHASCTGCHSGWNDPDSAPSACVDCHGFHTAESKMIQAEGAAP